MHGEQPTPPPEEIVQPDFDLRDISFDTVLALMIACLVFSLPSIEPDANWLVEASNIALCSLLAWYVAVALRFLPKILSSRGLALRYTETGISRTKNGKEVWHVPWEQTHLVINQRSLIRANPRINAYSIHDGDGNKLGVIHAHEFDNAELESFDRTVLAMVARRAQSISVSDEPPLSASPVMLWLKNLMLLGGTASLLHFTIAWLCSIFEWYGYWRIESVFGVSLSMVAIVFGTWLSQTLHQEKEKIQERLQLLEELSQSPIPTRIELEEGRWYAATDAPNTRSSVASLSGSAPLLFLAITQIFPERLIEVWFGPERNLPEEVDLGLKVAFLILIFGWFGYLMLYDRPRRFIRRDGKNLYGQYGDDFVKLSSNPDRWARNEGESDVWGKGRKRFAIRPYHLEPVPESRLTEFGLMAHPKSITEG